jgi:hypothetical protein
MHRLVLLLSFMLVLFTARFAAGQPQPTAAPDQPPAPVEQAYVGSNQCFICHRPHTNSWSESKHAEAFTRLPEKYRQDASCLKCHVTGFGEASGYVSGSEKDLLSVGCESCHGPGAKHIDAANRFVLATPADEAKLEKEMRQTTVKTPADSVCIKCHVTQAHQRHPAYQGQMSGHAAARVGAYHRSSHATLRAISSASTPYSSRYSFKTCGSCHYERYKHSITEGHSALSAILPPNYVNDQNCTQCHPKPNAIVKSSTDIADPHHNRIGAYCESCHGGGLEHVRFNRRYIGGPPLGPKLQQSARLSIREGKPAATCVGCHVGQGHKQHPEFAKTP